MPDILDIFNDDAFGIVSLTASINKQPFVPGQLGAAGLFNEDGVDTTTVVIEELNGSLALVAPSPRGGPGETVDKDKRKARSFRVPHFQRDDTIMADEVQGVRAFGQGSQLETVQAKIDGRLARHARDLDATLEHQRVGAIKGIVTDKSGNTMFNLFTEFGLTAPADITFTFSTSTTKVRQVCFDVINAIEDALDATTYSGIRGFCGKTFWKDLIEHQSVKETYLNTAQAMELRGDPNVYQFEFGGIMWERYRTGSKAKASAGGNNFIADTECRFVAMGVPDLFVTRFAPADYVETVNTIGLPRYAKQVPMRNGKGIELEVQTNAINICTQPATLIKGVDA